MLTEFGGPYGLGVTLNNSNAVLEGEQSSLH